MASAATFPKLRLGPRCPAYSQATDPVHLHMKIGDACKWPMPAQGLLVSTGRSARQTFLPVSAARSGRGASVAEAEKTGLSLDSFKITVVKRDDEKIHLRIELPGKETQKVFDAALTSLAKDAPPVPGFRRSKGGINLHFLARNILYICLHQVTEASNDFIATFLHAYLLDD
ncbi:hypothetical protein ACQJBY_024400 [Aegilops geniculata]